MAGPDPVFSQLEGYISSVRSEFEDMLGGLVEVPTISSDSARIDDIRHGADLAVQVFQRIGATAEIVETPGNPVVLGKLMTDPNHPTITIYNHLDVQPAQEPEWIREPFTFHVENGHYMGRGSTDDKGPALTALFAAKYAAEQGIPLNIHVIWELEEEIGSPNFEHFMLAKNHGLATGSVLVSDTVWISREKPAIPYALRGLQGATLSLETGLKDAHSGLTGGAARNPIGELCQVIERCYDPSTGNVAIPGFYDDVIPPSEEELDNFSASGFNVDTFMKAHGFQSLRSSNDNEVMDRIWCQPTFEVHGISGGYTGPGIKTVVPPRAEAKVSMRLVRRQEPEVVFQLLKDFVHEINSDVKVEPAGSLHPYMGEFHGVYAEAARRAIQFGFGVEPAFVREGGSIGAVITMEKHLQAPIMLIGLSLPEHGYHGPNEYFDWGQASGGVRSLVHYFSQVSKIPKA